jgi:uncharacterized membrane protein
MHWQVLDTRRQLVAALIFGVLFAVFTPPFQSPDEPNHFFRAWQVSEGGFLPEKSGNRLGGQLPVSLTHLVDSFSYLKNNHDARLSATSWYAAAAVRLNVHSRRFTDFANTAVYAPTAYLPQAVVLAVLRPLDVSPLYLLYAARLANLLVWLCLVGAAMRCFPALQHVFGALALLPATGCIAASANADVLTNGLCWWLVACMLARPQVKAGHFLALLVVVANKLIALPLALVVMVRHGITRYHIGVFLSAVLVAAWWGGWASAWFIPYDRYDAAFRDTQTLNSGVDPARQLAFMATHPWYCLQVWGQSLLHAFPSLLAHVTGKFGWEKNYLPAGWIGALWLALAAVCGTIKADWSRRQRLGLGVVVAAYVLAFVVTMYALWSAVGASKTDNWQGRYFIPILPLAAAVVGFDAGARWRNGLLPAAQWVLLAGNTAMVYGLYCRYWM